MICYPIDDGSDRAREARSKSVSAKNIIEQLDKKTAPERSPRSPINILEKDPTNFSYEQLSLDYMAASDAYDLQNLVIRRKNTQSTPVQSPTIFKEICPLTNRRSGNNIIFSWK